MRRFTVLAVLAPWLVAVDCDPQPSTDVEPEIFPCANTFDWADPGHPKVVNLYSWNGDEVIVVDKGCCDMYVEVYETAQCDYVCAPEGGITAFGDGRCPTFYDEATFIQNVYTE